MNLEAIILGVSGAVLILVAWLAVDHKLLVEQVALMRQDVQSSSAAMLRAAGDITGATRERDHEETKFLRDQLAEANRYARAKDNPGASVLSASQSGVGLPVRHEVIPSDPDLVKYQNDRSGMVERPGRNPLTGVRRGLGLPSGANVEGK